MYNHSSHKNPLLMKAIRHLLFISLSALLISGCKQDEDLQVQKPVEFVQITPGKYITYRLDSTVFTNFGRNTEVHSYQEKHIVDAQITDALGRTAYRIFRFTRDTGGLQPWQSAGSYMIVPAGNTVEIMEDNLRFVKLITPVTEGTTWKGNRFLPEEPYDLYYNFNNDFDIANWDYTYASTGETITLNNKTIEDVITVDGINEVVNVPVTDLADYGSINYQKEQYAKGIGMVFQELIMWEYQPNTGGTGGGFKVGFGIMRSMIDHN
jgi:hypothetical protein